MIDHFIRAEDFNALKSVLTSQAIIDVAGNLIDSETGVLIPAPDTEHKYWAPGTQRVWPPVYDAEGNNTQPLDPWCWFHLRLARDAERRDFLPDETDTASDRWNRSNIASFGKTKGTQATAKQLEPWPSTVTAVHFRLPELLGPQVQFWRGSDMQAQGLLFHEFLGRNDY